MSHAPILPVLVPIAAAAAMLLLGDRRIGAQRVLGVISCAVLLLIAIAAIVRTSSGVIDVYHLGGWPAPFGIVLVVDRLAALMLTLTAVVAVAALLAVLAAEPRWDLRGRHFHPLFQLELMGLNGAFVTGDVFNLFVFFEILLMASYCLLAHGRGAERLRAGFHYVVINLAASTLFLIGIALLYGVTGTLNFADLAVRAPTVAGGEASLLRAAVLLLLIVFALKAAVFPLGLWLPGAYAAAAAPVAALFSVMTKVGVYAILRLHGAVLGPDAGPWTGWLLAGAVATAGFGALGALATPTVGRLAGYLTLASIGTLLIPIGAGSRAGLAAALYYLAHSTFVTGALFLLAERIAAERRADDFSESRPVAHPAILGTLFLGAGLSAAGLPPLSGFVGKLMILQSIAPGPGRPWLWAALLATGLLAMIGLARAGSAVFWRATGAPVPPAPGALAALAPTVLLLACGVALTVLAAPIERFADEAIAQMADRGRYAATVLPATAEPTTKPLPAEGHP